MTMQGETNRVRCSVPFCGRTRNGDARLTEWVCAKHWCLVPRRFRRVMFRARRRGNYLVDYMAWRRCKKAAIEAAVGIA